MTTIQTVRKRVARDVAARSRAEDATVTKDPLAGEVRLLGAVLGDTIAEQAGADRFHLVECDAPGHGRTPSRACGRPRPAHRSPRAGGPGRRGGRGARVRHVLPARQPGRGAPADPDPADPRTRGARRDRPRLRGRGRRRAPGAGARRGGHRRALRAPAPDPRADRPSHRGPPADDAPRPAALRPAPGADRRTTRSGRPSTPRRCARCARSWRSCGTPRRSGRTPWSRSTRSARRWPSSTRRSSASCRSLPRGRHGPRPGQRARAPRASRPSCAWARGSAPIATATRGHGGAHDPDDARSRPTTCCAATRRSPRG